MKNLLVIAFGLFGTIAEAKIFPFDTIYVSKESTVYGVHQKVWGNHAASLISSGSFKGFIALNFGYFFLNSPSQSLFNTLVLA